MDFLVDCYQTLGLTNVVAGLFCETYTVLKDRHISKIRSEFPSWLGRLAKTDSGLDFVLRPEYGSGAIALRNLDDPSKYVSAEFAAIAVEELTKHQLSVFSDLRFRLRWPGIERPKFAAGTNARGVGKPWVRKYWIKQDFPPYFKGVDKLTGKPYDITNQFARVTAKASDNPHINESYHLRNQTLPPDMVREVVHSEWDMDSGQYFPRFDLKVHVIPHAEALARIQPWFDRGLSGDWGFEHPHCFHWHAKDERNCVITHHELWDRGIGEAEVGRRITAVEAQYFKLRKLSGFTFSWDAGKLSPRSSKGQPKAITQLVADALGPRVPKPHPCDSTPGVRLIRARLMSQVIEAETWLISDACPKLIAAIPEMIRNPDHPEEMLKVDWNEATIGDDPVDSAGMGLQWMIGTAVKPDSVKLEEKIQAVREQFLARSHKVQPPKPGTNWFEQFGGQAARNKK